MPEKLKILVTGGTGYIGSHTVVELQNQNFEVLIIDNLSNSDIKVLNNIEKITKIKPKFYNIDICNHNQLDNFFKENKNIDAVIHFAAHKIIPESIEKPLKYYENNLLGLINLIKNMKNHNLSNLVFSSSASVYGEADKFPVQEDFPIKKADSPYGNTKIIGEQIIKDYCLANKNFKATALRYFNPIGAHESSLIGELPKGIPANLIPFITQTAIGIRKELKIFGNDYDTPDGSCIRDFIHVVDLAQAHISAIKRMLDNKSDDNYEVFNIGTGQGTSVLEAIKIFEKVSGQKLNYSIAPRRPGDIVTSYANVDQAHQKLNWKAKKSIEDALLSSWKWEQAIKK